MPPHNLTVFRRLDGAVRAHRALWARRDKLGYLITGQAWGDYDGDGRLDLYVTSHRGPNRLYKNAGNSRFELSSLTSSVALPRRISGGATFVDYDNDGWKDLYVASYGRDALFRNERGKRFVDVTARAGLLDAAHSYSPSWGDYDGDGLLDLYVANYGCQPCDSPTLARGAKDRLFHNQGDGTFRDVTASLPAQSALDGWGFIAGWLDYDNDADLDLYLVNDVRGTRYLPGNALLRNDGPGCGHWCFTDVSRSSGAGVRMDGMGLAVADHDSDGDLDLYVTNTGWAYMPLTGPSVLLVNQGDGSFREAAGRAGVDVDAITWGATFLDYDSDGAPDLYVAAGRDPLDSGPQATLDRLFHNRGDGSFEDVSSTSGASHTDDSFGVARADHNGDGWPELVVGNVDEGYDVYANTASSGRGNHRLKVSLTGGGTVNRDAVGARVYVTASDGRTQMQEVMAGSSLGAGEDLALTFGLGSASVTSVRVRWPDGRTQSFTAVPSDVLWRLTYGAKPSVTRLPAPSLRATPAAPPPSQGLRSGGLVTPALAVLATLALAALLAAQRLRLPRAARRLLILTAVGAVSFQIAHFAEHVLQLGYWLLHPAEAPWITPWGRVATDGFAALAGDQGGRATGTELLHLAGNWIFFTGLVAMWAAARRSRRLSRRGRRATRVAHHFQLVHVGEHVSLTATYFALRTPIGISTLFGLAYYLPGAWQPSIRIWWHFGMNLIVTVAAIIALVQFRRAGLLTLPGPRQDAGRAEAGAGLQPAASAAGVNGKPAAAANGRVVADVEETAPT